MKDTIAPALIFITNLFIALKLTSVIDWAWKWVFAPIWLTVVLGLAVALIAKL